MRKQNLTFPDFLKVASGQKESGLIIAKDRDELNDFVEVMDNKGLKRLDKISNMTNSLKVYLNVGENIEKETYDFLVQYPTGQVEIFDKDTMLSKTFSPDYKNSSVVVLILKENLGKLKQKGWDILSIVGPAYQS